uniref:EGF-like domain-containing protein n=1 Tax=Eptatretus burgeri TaxID=7764 RepID=A0A8C4R8P3_EPTBU
DECFESSRCDGNAICYNTVGSFSCHCNSGFSGNGQECTDVNECSVNNGGCSQLCHNNAGSFDCSCHTGYQKDTTNQNACLGMLKAYYINECSVSSACPPSSNCSNTLGSYTCTCASGYNKDGNTCTGELISLMVMILFFPPSDINECTSSNTGCSQVCLNTPGSFHCSCLSGYEFSTGSNTQCVGKRNVDECLKTNNCHPNATCTNSIGSYACICKAGYVGNGKSFAILLFPSVLQADIDECSKPNTCHASATCTNTAGSYTCQCLTGYQGDGHSCAGIDPRAARLLLG